MKLLLICSSLWWTDGFREIFSYRVKIVIKSVCQVDIIKIFSGILHDSGVRKNSIVSWPRLRTSPFTLAFYGTSYIFLVMSLNSTIGKWTVISDKITPESKQALWKFVMISMTDLLDSVSLVLKTHIICRGCPALERPSPRDQVTAETDPYRAVSWSRKALLWKRAVEASYASQGAMEWSGIDY